MTKLSLLARVEEARKSKTVEITRPLRGANGVTLAAAPQLRDGVENGVVVIRPGADGIEVTDSLVYPDESGAPYIEDELDDENSGEVRITINGEPLGAAGGPVNAAAVLPLTSAAIPDPSQSLLRSTPLGTVPRIASDGRKSVDYYAKPFDPPPATPMVAIVVGGLGLNTSLTERAIDDLPAEVSLSFAPYAKNLEFWTKKARAAGHEVLIELPMEGHGKNQSGLGAAALLSSRTPEENLQRLDWLMSRFGGYFAATNYMGSKFSTDEKSIAPILAKLNEAGVGYIDDTGSVRKAGERTGVNWTVVNRMIPPAPDGGARKKVRKELDVLEKIAARDGAAIGKTYAYATTIDEIAAWASELRDKKIAAAPASAVLHARRAAR